MNNLHRELAPISSSAWAQIEAEAKRTIRRHLAGRRIIDSNGPHGSDLAAVDTGRLNGLQNPADGITAALRDVLPLVQFRVPFMLKRDEIDAVERGSLDSDWEPVKIAAKKIAFCEDRAIFSGYPAAGIRGLREAASSEALTLPEDVRDYVHVISEALNTLRLSGVGGPYSVVLGAQAYLAVTSGDDEGYPVQKHLEDLIDGKVIWAPAIEGAFVLSGRGGDYVIEIGEDFSIGYLDHTADTVRLYLQESFTFRVLTAEAVVALDMARGNKQITN